MAATEISSDAARGFSGVRLVGRGAPRLGLLWRVRRKIREWSAAESGRLALWAPVALGAGAAFYFGLKSEPPFWFGLVLLLLAAGLHAGLSGAARKMAGAAFLIALGFVAADLRTARVDAPALDKEISPRLLTGRLVGVEEAPASRRLLIEVHSIARYSRPLPERARVTWRGEGFDAAPGDVIRIRAGLSPPPPPAAPGAFDFARHLFFQRIGAVGYAVSAPETIEKSAQGFHHRFAARIERARVALARRILDRAPGEGGAIVAALVTGKRGAISERAQAALRDSGLAHLLAISGLHMGLATGLVFFAARFALALIEPVALRFPVKKWAAGAALLSGLAYLLLSGGGWSAQRAFIMSSIVFIAILADRRALSLRNVALAATVILLATPEAVLHPGFRMSFAAVTALVGAYEWAAGRADPDRSFSFLARLRRYLVALGATDAIAASAAAPTACFIFIGRRSIRCRRIWPPRP